MYEEIEELEQKLKSEDVSERQEACYQLGKMEDPEAAEILLRALDDPDPLVQSLAQKSLTRLEQLELIPAGTLAGHTPTAPAPVQPQTPPPPPPSASPPASPLASPPSPASPPTPSGTKIPKFSLPTPKPPAPPPPPEHAAPAPVAAAEEEAIALPPLKISAPAKAPPPPPKMEPAKAPPPPPSVPEAEAPAEDYEALLPPLKPNASPAAQKARAKAPSPPPPEPSGPEPAAAPGTSGDAAVTEIPPSGDIGEWKAVISERGDAFSLWFAKKNRKDKIDILSEMEKASPNILWSKKVQPFLTSESDAFVISKLLKVFGLHHGPRILKYVEPFLDHTDTRVISNCLEALSLAGDPEDLERITQFLDHADSRIKSTAAQALWKANPKKALEVVRRLAFSQRVWERDAAKFALVSCPLEERKALLEALQRKGGKPAVPGPEGATGGTATPIKAAVDKEKNDMPEWAQDLGPLGKILVFPVNLGLEEPIPLWMLFTAAIVAVLAYFLIIDPIFNMIFPAPKM